jgi:hypothetical protein
MASKEIEMNQQGTAGNKQYVTLTIPYKLETIRRLKSGDR